MSYEVKDERLKVKDKPLTTVFALNFLFSLFSQALNARTSRHPRQWFAH